MSDLFGNLIVGFPMRRLNRSLENSFVHVYENHNEFIHLTFTCHVNIKRIPNREKTPIKTLSQTVIKTFSKLFYIPYQHLISFGHENISAATDSRRSSILSVMYEMCTE